MPTHIKTFRIAKLKDSIKTHQPRCKTEKYLFLNVPKGSIVNEPSPVFQQLVDAESACSSAKMKQQQIEKRPVSIIQVSEHLSENPLIRAIGRVLIRLADFKDFAREFYFAVILSAHSCPKCDGRFSMAGEGQAKCDGCNIRLDPTVAFQRSPCCGARLAQRMLHYACSQCGKIVPSRFLFDERLFDKAYFREMMRESRARAAKKKEDVRRLLANSKSDELKLHEVPSLEAIPGLESALDNFIQRNEVGEADLMSYRSPVFCMDRYRDHLHSVLGSEANLFSSINPMIENRQLDKIWRFITLIFMWQDREVDLRQYGSDLLIQTIQNETYQ